MTASGPDNGVNANDYPDHIPMNVISRKSRSPCARIPMSNRLRDG